MPRKRPQRVQALKGIGVDQMGSIGDATGGAQGAELLRLENLDVNIPPHTGVIETTSQAIHHDDNNSYLPFIGQRRLRDIAAQHVSNTTGGAVQYSGEANCVISAGGLSGILNVLLATVEQGDGVLMTDPTYAGLINRVKLAGGVPVLAPLDFHLGAEWRLNRQLLRQLVEDPANNITTILLGSPGLPSGAYLDAEDWTLITELCVTHDILLIWDAAFEGLLFDGRPLIHPAGLPGMAERVVTVGSASKELRMIGWRVGWVVAPSSIIPDIATVALANVVVPVGIAQDAAAAALQNMKDDLPAYVAELQARRDLLVRELYGLPFGVPAGGWSRVLRVDSFGLTGKQTSQNLLEQGVCATPMDGWGEEHGSQYVRFVFSNESQERLKGLGEKVRRALGIK